MKRIIIFSLFIVSVLATSCNKEKCFSCDTTVRTNFYDYQFPDYECGSRNANQAANDVIKKYEAQYPNAYEIYTSCVED